MSGYTHSRLETAGTKPTSAELKVAEIVVNTVDNTLYSKRSDGTVISVGGGGAIDDMFLENAQVVQKDYTIVSDRNAMSAGPIDIPDGTTVTVEAGAIWTIV